MATETKVLRLVHGLVGYRLHAFVARRPQQSAIRRSRTPCGNMSSVSSAVLSRYHTQSANGSYADAENRRRLLLMLAIRCTCTVLLGPIWCHKP